jgi:serine/threonine-protein kinase
MTRPRMIGQYQLAEPLGTGGAGEVYRGIDTKVGREVAVKFLRPELASDPVWEGRFLAEAKSLGRLNHPNVATLYTLVQENGQICMIMELVRGRTVEEILEERRGPLGVRESLAVIAQAADGLAYAHEQGVIHRDIKPSNLMVTEAGRVKIMDFGIARVQGSSRLTRAGTAIGTALYMSPEQHQGLEGDERSDIYSLGLVLYELLAGAPPFKGASDFELAKAHLGTPPPPLIPRVPFVEPRLESAVMTALAKRPEQRFPTMRAFSDAAGATALRGDAAAIIESHVLTRPGQAPLEIKHRPPIHQTALAVARSRMASLWRRFRMFHPAAQGALAGFMLVAAAGAILILHTAPGPPPAVDSSAYPKRSSTQKDSEAQQNAPNRDASSSLRTVTQADKPPVQERRNSTLLEVEGYRSPQPRDASLLKPDTGEGKPALSTGSRESPSREKLAFADFETAYDQGDYGEAAEIAKKLDAAGDPGGAYGLGLLYGRGEGVKQDPVRARMLFYHAADQGHPMAMAKLGLMYHEGLGGDKNITMARKWFERAAEKGVGEAMFNLGAMCQRKEMPRCNAKDLYRNALQAGYRPAKQRLEELGE